MMTRRHKRYMRVRKRSDTHHARRHSMSSDAIESMDLNSNHSNSIFDNVVHGIRDFLDGTQHSSSETHISYAENHTTVNPFKDEKLNLSSHQIDVIKDPNDSNITTNTDTFIEDSPSSFGDDDPVKACDSSSFSVAEEKESFLPLSGEKIEEKYNGHDEEKLPMLSAPKMPHNGKIARSKSAGEKQLGAAVLRTKKFFKSIVEESNSEGASEDSPKKKITENKASSSTKYLGKKNSLLRMSLGVEQITIDSSPESTFCSPNRRHSSPSSMFMSPNTLLTPTSAASRNSTIFSIEAGQQLRVNFPCSQSPLIGAPDSTGDNFNLEEAFMFVASGYFELDPSQINIDCPIASGAFATVNKGSLLEEFFPKESDDDTLPLFELRSTSESAKSNNRGVQVAVKLQPIPVNHVEQANMLGELAILRALCTSGQNERLVKYFGAALMEDDSPQVMMVMELCANGAVREALQLHLSWSLRVRIAMDVALALDVLHQYGVIHRDIKTTNVLLDSNWRAKLCDFNLAIDDNSAAKLTHAAGTTEFMSPEVLLGCDFSFSTDIFGFGIMLIEMITGRTPGMHDFLVRHPRDFFLVDLEELESFKPNDVSDSLWRLTLDCCDKEADIRPLAADAVAWLKDILEIEFDNHVILPKNNEYSVAPILSPELTCTKAKTVSFADPGTCLDPCDKKSNVVSREGQRLDGSMSAAMLRRKTLKSLNLNDVNRVKEWAALSAPRNTRSFRNLNRRARSTSASGVGAFLESDQWSKVIEEIESDDDEDRDTFEEKELIKRPTYAGAQSVPERGFMHLLSRMENELSRKNFVDPVDSPKRERKSEKAIDVAQYQSNLLERIHGLDDTVNLRLNLDALLDPIHAINAAMDSCAIALYEACTKAGLTLPGPCCDEDLGEGSSSDASDDDLVNVKRLSANSRSNSRISFCLSPILGIPKGAFTPRGGPETELTANRSRLVSLVERLAIGDAVENVATAYITQCRLAVDALSSAVMGERNRSRSTLDEAHSKFREAFLEARRLMK